MNKLHTWLIEPHDPLIARDGRPFSTTPGARATSLPFPAPPTLAGAARTLAGSDPQSGQFIANPDDVLKWQMCGPLLVELNDQQQTCWMVPAPADALLLRHTEPGKAIRKQLVPLNLPDQGTTDLEASLDVIGTRDYDPSKPLATPPTFWYWKAALAWLKAPLHPDSNVTIDSLGHQGPIKEARVHVGIDLLTQTASEGLLFQTRGLEFIHRERDTSLHQAKRLALALATDAPLHPAVAPVGGERRMARWQPTNEVLPGTDAEVETISKAIAAAGGCRVLLLTPALFDGGFRPNLQSYLIQPLADTHIQIELCGVAVGRAQILSGWDMTVNNGAGKPRGTPKATRRFAPAGTVLFLKVAGEADAIKHWVKERWMRCVSDGEQERRDGFGLAIFGVWSGEPETIPWGQRHAKTEDSTLGEPHP